ncbi:MAG: class I SAM-dependent methyltransferase, partial [Oscillospiraceae bacterium]
GCGLDARAKRIGFPAKIWYDLDFSQVIDIKKQLYSETDNYRFVSSSVTDWEWMDGIAFHRRPVLVIAEGLLMYLLGQDVETLFLKLRDKFKDVTVIFDAYSKLTARHAGRHPSLKKTGAAIQWGIDLPKEIEAFGDGIYYKKTLYFTDQSAIESLPKNYRLIFKIAGGIKAAREAHRIFVMELNSIKNLQ